MLAAAVKRTALRMEARLRIWHMCYTWVLITKSHELFVILLLPDKLYMLNYIIIRYQSVNVIIPRCYKVLCEQQDFLFF